MLPPSRTCLSPGGWPPRSRPGTRAILATLIVLVAPGSWSRADPPSGADAGAPGTEAPAPPGAAPNPADLEDRLRRLEALGTAVQEQNRRLTEQNRRLAEQNQRLANQLQDVSRRLDRVAAPPMPTVAAPTPTQDGSPADDPAWSSPPLPTLNGLAEDETSGSTKGSASRFLIGGYNQERSQFVLVQPTDPERTPFSLNFDLITELRYTGFARSDRSWRDSANLLRPIRNYNQIEVNRNWFQFSGYALDPRLRYTAVVFSSSTNNATIFLGWLDYQFSKAFQLSGGYFKVPGSREWSDSYRYTLGADRTMATTFFRPSMSPGIWASGEPLENLHYIAMVANSFNGLDLAGNRIGSNMAFAGSAWWEPMGAFGPGPSDIEWHDRLTPRLGTSLTVSRERLPGPTAIQTNPEDTLFRLSDGTPLSETGALAPGVQIQTTSVQLWSIDAAAKYRGLSLSGEYYLRWLNGFKQTGGPLAVDSLFAQGAYAQASYFVLPRRLEGYARFSFVSGQFGGGNEWSGGLNWYVNQKRNWRMTFDVTRINHSPAENLLTGYRAGESGTLFQLQMLTDF